MNGGLERSKHIKGSKEYLFIMTQTTIYYDTDHTICGVIPFFVSVSFCSLTKRITPKMCRFCVCVLINKRSFEAFMCLDLILER